MLLIEYGLRLTCMLFRGTPRNLGATWRRYAFKEPVCMVHPMVHPMGPHGAHGAPGLRKILFLFESIFLDPEPVLGVLEIELLIFEV